MILTSSTVEQKQEYDKHEDGQFIFKGNVSPKSLRDDDQDPVGRQKIARGSSVTKPILATREKDEEEMCFRIFLFRIDFRAEDSIDEEVTQEQDK
ncbi:hypothetical protein E2C01_070098 [Portunus trituberculatus]|uniref:Uncharacterized protein n=1 Tax=Portunus trituberculatus TaxID=210409 RepID=A0A5B7I0N7_PORTR|nr:hypothetical protein [Portunus trituberculatus]